MSVTITFNGGNYVIPQVGDEAWGDALTSYFQAIPQGALQKTGGTFTLGAEVDFGVTYGLKSAYFKGRTTLPAAAGVLRLSKTDTIEWRNNANAADNILAVDGTDILTYNGIGILTAGGSIPAPVAFTGVSDAVQITVVGYSTQTNPIFQIKKSGGTVLFGVDNAGSISSTSSTTNLAVANITGTSRLLAISGSNTGGQIALGIESSTGGSLFTGTAAYSTVFGTGGATGVEFATNNISRLKISSAGVVNIPNLTAGQAVVTDGSSNLVSLNYASANSASTLVFRDGSGNFSAGTITAALIGNASSATAIAITDDNSTNATVYPVWVTANTGNLPAKVSSTQVNFNPSTGNLSATSFNKVSITNPAASATLTVANLKTVIFNNTLTFAGTDGSTLNIGAGGTLGSNAFSSAAYAPLASPSFTGTVNIASLTASQAVVTDASKNLISLSYTPAATASTIVSRDSNINVGLNNLSLKYATTVTAAGNTVLTAASAYHQYFTGTTTQTITLPAANTLAQIGFPFNIVNLSSGVVTINDNGGNVLQSMASGSYVYAIVTDISTANGAWQIQYSVNSAGGGTVTSVGMTVPSFLSIGGSPVTSSGVLAVSYSGTALPVLNGGTGVTTSTGTGNNVLSTSPTLVTPVLGVATGTSLALTGTLGVDGAPAPNGTTTGSIVIGRGGSANTVTGNMILNGSSAAGFGPYIGLQVASANKIALGALSAILGSGTSADAVLYAATSQNLFLYSGGAQAAQFDSSQNSKFAGVVTANAASSAPLVVQSSSGATGQGIQFKNPAASGKYNFYIGNQNNIDNGLEITASTAVDGTTYTTPLVRILQTGGITLPGTLGVGVAADAIAIAYVKGANLQSGNGAVAVLTVENTSAASGAVNTLALRNTSSTVNDGASLLFEGLNASSAFKTYATIQNRVITNTAGAEDGSLEIRTMRAGAPTTAMTIDQTGNLLIGTNNTNPIGGGVSGIVASGTSGNLSLSRSAAPALDVNRYTSDGTLARFYRSGSQVGSIDVTTTTVGLSGSGGTGLTIDSSGNVKVGASNNIKGSDGTASAAAGNVGEYIFGNSAGVSPVTTGVKVIVASISLTAGDWDVDATSVLNTSSTTGTGYAIGISLTTTSLDTTNAGGLASASYTLNSSFGYQIPVSIRRIILTTTTTVYLIANLNYTVLGSATWTNDSIIRARRVR